MHRACRLVPFSLSDSTIVDSSPRNRGEYMVKSSMPNTTGRAFVLAAETPFRTPQVPGAVICASRPVTW